MKIKIKYMFIILACVGVIFQDQILVIYNLPFLTYSDEILILLLLFLAVIRIARERAIHKFTIQLIVGMFLFSIIGITSGYINSKNSFNINTVLEANFLSIKFLLIVFACTNIEIKKSTIEFMLQCMEVIAKITVLIAVMNLFLPNIYLKLFPWGFIQRRFGIISPCSIFEHPATYGWFLMVVASYHYIQYLQNRQKKGLKKFILYAIFAMLSMKAKVILGLIMVLLVGNIFFSNNKHKFKNIAIPFVLTFTLVLMFKDFLIETYVRYFTLESGVTARSALNINSLNIFTEYFPLGVGFGKYASYYARINYSEYYYKYRMTGVYGLRPENPIFSTDTFWPSILGETGFLGTMIYLLCLISIFNQLRKKIVVSEYNILAIWGLMIFLQGILESLGAPIFNSAPQNIIMGLIIGIALRSRKKEVEN